MDLLNLDLLPTVRARYRVHHGSYPEMERDAAGFFRTEWRKNMLRWTAALRARPGVGPQRLRDCPLRIVSSLCYMVVNDAHLPSKCRTRTLGTVIEELLRAMRVPTVDPLPPNWREDLLAAITSGNHPRLYETLKRIYGPLPDPNCANKKHGDCDSRCQPCLFLWAPIRLRQA